MIEDKAKTLRYQDELDEGEMEERRQEYRDWIHGQLLGFRAFVQDELDRRPKRPKSYVPTDRWFYEEAAEVLPAIIDGTATERDEHRLAMAAHAIQLSMRLEDAEVTAGGDTQRARLQAAMDVSEVPFQHPWVFHLEHDRHGMPYVAWPSDGQEETGEETGE